MVCYFCWLILQSHHLIACVVSLHFLHVEMPLGCRLHPLLALIAPGELVLVFCIILLLWPAICKSSCLMVLSHFYFRNITVGEYNSVIFFGWYYQYVYLANSASGMGSSVQEYLLILFPVCRLKTQCPPCFIHVGLKAIALDVLVWSEYLLFSCTWTYADFYSAVLVVINWQPCSVHCWVCSSDSYYEIGWPWPAYNVLNIVCFFSFRIDPKFYWFQLHGQILS